MRRVGTASRNIVGRIGLFVFTGAICLTIAAASTNAAGFSFMDSVKEFFGFATVQTTAPAIETTEPNSAPAMEPMYFFTSNQTIGSYPNFTGGFEDDLGTPATQSSVATGTQQTSWTFQNTSG